MFNFQLLKNIYASAKWSFSLLGFLIVFAIFGNILATERAQALLPPLIPYAYSTQDSKNVDFVSPFSQQDVSSLYYRHWLGTDLLGRDVLAGLIAGTRTALSVGIGGMGIALFIGLLLGLVAGYFGDNRFRLSKIGLILRGVMLLFLIFYTVIFFQQKLNFILLILIFIGIYLIINILDKYLNKILDKTFCLNKKISIPIDMLIMRSVEVLQAIPTILWLLGLIAVTGRMSIFGLILFIGFTGWMSLARLVRGQVIRVRHLEYVESAQALGYSDFRILTKHILPNILTPILIAVSFGIANCVLLEAFLTFSGLGLPIEQVTWGSLLTASRDNPSAWWMVVFPGLAIFLTVTIFNRIGEALSEK